MGVACDQNRRGVGGVWGRRRIVGPVGVADPLRCSSSSDAVADDRPCARGVAKGELERNGEALNGGDWPMDRNSSTLDAEKERGTESECSDVPSGADPVKKQKLRNNSINNDIFHPNQINIPVQKDVIVAQMMNR